MKTLFTIIAVLLFSSVALAGDIECTLEDSGASHKGEVIIMKCIDSGKIYDLHLTIEESKDLTKYTISTKTKKEPRK